MDLTGAKDYFEKVAPEWDRIRSSFYSDRVREAAFARAGVRAGRLAADAGAGTGFLTEGLLARGLSVVAVEPVREMRRELARKLAGRGRLLIVAGGAEGIPLCGGSVDHVFANMVLHHVPDPPAAIAEMARILVPGGTLAVTDLDLHAHEFLAREHHDRWPGFDRADVARWLSDAGLVDLSVESAPEPCCGESHSCGEKAAIGIWIACGRKP